jgi:hypothetical protein
MLGCGGRSLNFAIFVAAVAAVSFVNAIKLIKVYVCTAKKVKLIVLSRCKVLFGSTKDLTNNSKFRLP